jgi:hypothetical protein
LMQSVEGNDGFGSDHLYPPHCSTSLLDPTWLLPKTYLSCAHIVRVVEVHLSQP